MILGLDYAGGRPGGAAISAHGYQFVVRYLSDGGPGLPGKLLTAAEYRDLQIAGIAVVCNWETSATRMLGGRAAGHADAQTASGVCQSLGHPSDRPIYFSADWDVAPGQQGAVDDYLRGVAEVIGLARAGVYGGYWVVKRCLDNGTARWGWQTGAWSGGNVDPRIHLYQRIGYVSVGGVQCDVNEARQLDFGQCLSSGPVTPPPPAGPGPESIPLMNYGETSDEIKHLQSWCNGMFPAYSHINPVSGYYGDQTTAVIKEFQARVGIRGGDGRNVGNQTRQAVWSFGFRG
jgi:peptidoglycan hydrolase-like protein with peptidoglycan-binding domain